MKWLRKKLANLNACFDWNPLSAAIAFFVYVHALDIVSTCFSVKCFNLVEGNSLMTDPNGDFLLFWAIFVKLIFAVSFPGALSYFIKKGTQSLYFASSPFWYFGIQTLFDADYNNIGLILRRIKDIWFIVH